MRVGLAYGRRDLAGIARAGWTAFAAGLVFMIVAASVMLAIPAALSGSVASSLGCVGNRVYTGVTDDEYYTVISGRDLALVVDQMATVASANDTLADYHRQRRATLATV